MMILQIKNMKSSRCKTFVEEELNKLGFLNITVEFGEVILNENISSDKLRIFDSALRNGGLEVLGDKKNLLVEKIKAAVYDLVYLTDDIPKPNYSDYISEKVNLSYTSLSTIFSSIQGINIEKYIIIQRVERIKELLIYTDLSLSDIAFKLHYSSVAHLSNQFKKMTGLNPSYFRQYRNSEKNIS